jgi:GNAT superfamily N-acetyltransferase
MREPSNASTPADTPAQTSADALSHLPPARLHVLPDGTRLLVRPLVAEDRDEMQMQYGHLSPESRRLRFVSAPGHLSEQLLDHLFDVDFVDRYALVGALVDEPGVPGVGVARYVRRRDEPATAEAAVTVIDDHQRRGIGTVLLTELVDAALRNGITTFTGDVMWDNRGFLDRLKRVGASVQPGEPGLASVLVELPSTVEELTVSPVYHVLRAAGTG